MKIYKLSHGGGYLNDDSFRLLKDKNLASLHPNTPAKGVSSKTQAEAFFESKIGDLFYVCRSNNSIEIIGMFIDERPLFSVVNGHEDWVDREYVLIANAVNPEAYNKSFDKWWSPKNVSTYIEIPNHDLSLFEQEILQPVFNNTLEDLENKRNTELEKNKPKMEDYIAMQLDFKGLMNNDDALFQKINALTNIELKKIEYTYLKRGDISKQPVVLLRNRLLELLLKGEKLNASIINQIKQELDALFDTNVYHAWSSNYRILYTFLFDKHKSDLEAFFKQVIKQLQKDLELEIKQKKYLHLTD